MTDEIPDEAQAAAYMKLQLDVRQLIIDTVYAELQNYGSPLHKHIAAPLLTGYAFRDNVRMVIKEQMSKD